MRRRAFYLKLTLSGEVSERPAAFNPFTRKEQIFFPDLLRLLQQVNQNSRVTCLFICLKRLIIGWAQLEELVSVLDECRESGKSLLFYVEEPSNKLYYLATAGSRVYVPPATTLNVAGLRSEVLFFKNLLAFLGVEPELFNVGEFKSAAEIFLRHGMSAANREMTDSILSDLQSRLISRIADRRGVSKKMARDWVDQGTRTAKEALSDKMVDGLRYEDEIEQELKASSPKLRELPISKVRFADGFFTRLLTFRRSEIALVVAEGMITSGESRRGRGRWPLLGSKTVAEILQNISRRKRIKAVVLRVNSPGGSGLASDLIWREVKRVDDIKPVIISFGDTAASGGFYIASAGRTILASRNTLTGSIGVVGGKFNIRGLLTRLGVTVDTIDKSRNSGFTSSVRPFTKDEAATIQKHLQSFYEDLFLPKIAKNRKKSPDEIRQFAEGRVWTGNQAKERGLVDKFGGLLDALELAREYGALVGRRFRIVQYSPKQSLRDLFFPSASDALAHDRVLALMPQDFNIS
jgi:protease-4